MEVDQRGRDWVEQPQKLSVKVSILPWQVEKDLQHSRWSWRRWDNWDYIGSNTKLIIIPFIDNRPYQIKSDNREGCSCPRSSSLDLLSCLCPPFLESHLLIQSICLEMLQISCEDGLLTQVFRVFPLTSGKSWRLNYAITSFRKA